jgi:predicted thioredoxin/glutaredoxin
LGSGYAKCNQLEAVAVTALDQPCLGASVDLVRFFAQIASNGVMSTPALLADGEIIFSNRVPKTQKSISILKKGKGCGDAQIIS